MTCLDEDTLVRVHCGDGSVAECDHAAVCARCASALAALASDLRRIDAVLRAGTPALRPRRAWLPQLVPAAVAAALVLAFVMLQDRSTPSAADADTLALLDELTSAVASYDAAGIGLDLGEERGERAAGSTCTWGEPFLQMGCDQPAATQVAWR